MTWPLVRAKVRDLLAAVAITEPLAETVRRVYEFPPAAIESGDLPCFLMVPPRREQEFGPNQSVIRTYTMRIQFFCRDEGAASAAEIADNYAESVMSLLIPALRVNGVDATVSVAGGPQIDEPSGLSYAGSNYIGFNMTITIGYSFFNAGFAP